MYVWEKESKRAPIPPLTHSPVPKASSMDTEGTMLLMAVFDYDIVGSNDLCGLCVIPCNRIPRLSNKGSITRPSGPERKNYHLPLFTIQPTAAFRLESVTVCVISMSHV